MFKTLKMGIDSPTLTIQQEKARIKELQDTVQHYIPDFARGVKEMAEANKKLKDEDKAAVMVMCQDAFAAGYQDDEYIIFGMALKYAGLCGLEIFVIPGPSGLK